MTVNHEHHLVDTVKFRYQLGSFEGCQSLARACGVPNIAITVSILNLVDNFLYGIVLIWYQSTMSDLSPSCITTYLLIILPSVHLSKKVSGKNTQFIVWLISLARPIESKLEALIWIVGKVAGIDSVGNHEYLDIVKQPVERSLVITLNLVIVLFSGSMPRQLQFNLYQR